MNAREEAIKKIKAKIDRLPTGPFGEAMLDEIPDAPPLGAFLEQDPDVYEELSEEDIIRIINARKHRDQNKSASGNCSSGSPGGCNLNLPPFLLGLYKPMRSPGTVLLFGDNLELFFWSLIREISRTLDSITHSDLSAVNEIVVNKTYYHELFHYDCDVFRHLFGGKRDPLKEEALAVARSRWLIEQDRGNRNTTSGRMNGVVYGKLMDLAFKYQSAGYNKWHLYASEQAFRSGLLDLYNSQMTSRLESNEVAVDSLIFSLLGKMPGGYREYTV